MNIEQLPQSVIDEATKSIMADLIANTERQMAWTLCRPSSPPMTALEIESTERTGSRIWLDWMGMIQAPTFTTLLTYCGEDDQPRNRAKRDRAERNYARCARAGLAKKMRHWDRMVRKWG